MRYVWWGGTSFVCICPVNILQNWAFLYALEYPGIPGVQLGFSEHINIKNTWSKPRNDCISLLTGLE